MRQKMRFLSVAGSLFILGAIFFAPKPAHAAPVHPHGSCQEASLKVAMHTGAAKDQTISGTYCTPTTWAAGAHRVDTLVPGATYNREYWDSDYQTPKYSYVDRTLQAGRATFDYDRLGDGKSSKPSGLAVTIPVEAYVLHQINGWLRSDKNYAQVNVVGHSLGSLIAIQNASTYPKDPDRLVITGIVHAPSLSVGLPLFFSTLRPAPLDPQFVGRTADLTYLTTAPNTRDSAFYSPSADPGMVAYDEIHKDVVSTGDTASAVTQLEGVPLINPTITITAPTMAVVGEQDALFCGPIVDCAKPGAVRANEAPYYASAKNFTVATEPKTGHDLALHPSADSSFQKINSWLQSH